MIPDGVRGCWLWRLHNCKLLHNCKRKLADINRGMI